MSVWDDASGRLKDEALDALAARFNVAQFVSFGPGPRPRLRFVRVRGTTPGSGLSAPEVAIATLLAHSASGSVNVRTFRPEKSKGNPFHYGLTTTEEVVALVRQYTEGGMYVIVNETIDVYDGGVSGVRMSGVTEFAPCATPRVVEEEGTCSLDDATADRLFDAVYGVELPFPKDPNLRVEFSVHPIPRGYRRQRWIVWEVERLRVVSLHKPLRWPNRFSRHVGDKAFGLLIADLAELPVPGTLVVARALPPFRFGTATGTGDLWIRTCPVEFSPGTFPTVHGWTDPFELLAESDPTGQLIASVLVQEGVEARWSGAARSETDGVLVEGVAGSGDRFMMGLDARSTLPERVAGEVEALFVKAEARFGPIRAEWVTDDDRVWLVQLNQQGQQQAVAIAPGEATSWLRYDPANGLDALHALVEQAKRAGAGVEVVRDVGLTSHVGDVLRAAEIPARIGAEAS